MRPKFEIKGIRDGLLITLGDGLWSEVSDSLLEQIQARAEFFQGAHLALDVGNYILHAVELSQLRDRLSEKGVNLWAVVSNSPTTEQTAQVLGLATRLSKPKPEPPRRNPSGEVHEADTGILVQRTLRSGMKLQYAGHITVIGDVNPGAEIVARGNVIVWGRMRGVVQAGAEGDESAVVCALDLSPTQLRIAGHIATTPQRRGKPQPEIARLRDGQVVADPWSAGGKTEK
jgi:septum site-determining protein MinC